jgi:hypothetical protein
MPWPSCENAGKNSRAPMPVSNEQSALPKGRNVTLARNKRLVLSIALNVLLAGALSILLYLVYPQFIYELESVNNWQRYSVRTYRSYENGAAYFEVLMGPEEWLRQPKVRRRIYSYSGTQAFYVEKVGADVTGNGVPDLVIRQWYGSAHGDSKYLVLELDGSVVKEIDVVDHLLGVECQDLNDDGILEITGVDRSYIFFLGESCAASPSPPVVLSFDKTQARFVLDKKLMARPPFSRDQFNELSAKYKNDPQWSKESHPPSDLFDTMLNLIYTGNEGQAWELFDASWPDGSTISKEQYQEDVRAELNRSHFYPAIADWNKEKL